MKSLMEKVKTGVLFCIKWRYLIAFVVFVLCVVLQLHGSSIAEYNNMFENKGQYDAEGIVMGESRRIRSDEWLVSTPYFMSQTYNDFNKKSDMMSKDGQDMLVSSNSPVLDITVLAKPFSWGYMLLGNDYGLSWYWCMKVILLLLMSFEFCMIITGKNKKVSLLGMLMVGFAPPVQWWFGIVDIFLFGMILFIAGYYFFTAKRRWKKNVLIMGAALAAVAYVLALFPSLQIPVGLVLVALFVGVLIRDKKMIIFQKIDILRIIIAVVVAVSMLAYTVLTSMDGLVALSSTTYPGARMSLGGNFVFEDLFTDLVTFTLPYKDITYSNNSEISSFIQFAPVFFMIYPIMYKKMKRDKNMIVGNFMLTCLIVMIVFMFAGFPQLLAKLTLFSYINRMDLAYGFFATIFTVWGVSMIWKKDVLTRKQIWGVILIYGFLNVCLVGERELTYLEWWMYGVIIVGLVILVYLMLKRRQMLFLVGMAVLMLVSGFLVNPVARGTSALTGHTLEKKIHEIAEGDSEAYWLAVDNRLISSIGIANGAKMLNMVNYYPDYGKWKLIDPEGKYDDIYNRYAHINVTLTEKGKTKVKIGETEDVLDVILTCEDLGKWDAKYLTSPGELEECEDDYEEIYKDTEGNYYIYERISDEKKERH